jgi:hypothetical protein
MFMAMLRARVSEWLGPAVHRLSGWGSPWRGAVVFGSKSAPIYLVAGKNSARTSWRLASRSAARRLTPVVLPPGRESDP